MSHSHHLVFYFVQDYFPEEIAFFQGLLPCPTSGSQCNWFSVTSSLKVCALPFYVYWVLQTRRVASIGTDFLSSYVKNQLKWGVH